MPHEVKHFLMNWVSKLIVASLLFCIPMNMKAQRAFYFEMLPGAVYALPANLKIHQEGFPVIDFKAQYKVEPFKSPFYYSFRTPR